MDSTNPFNITKAVDLSDNQIEQYWVDFSTDQVLLGLLKPRSVMPMLILGGKGSGKTHLMRYCSYPLQRLRHRNNIPQGIHDDGYLGIYLRCGGLNSSRFEGKGQSPEVWADVFAYYMELWISQMLLNAVTDIYSKSNELEKETLKLCNAIADLFDEPLDSMPTSLSDILTLLQKLQKDVDLTVNNSSSTHNLDVRIRITRGHFIFGLPRLLSQHLPSFKGVLVVYLLDEFENLTESQQKYINTLIRERDEPCTFKVGSRLYGVKTYRTFSSEEENKEGSEYEVLPLDALLRKQKEYPNFARSLCKKRLLIANKLLHSDTINGDLQELDRWFEIDERTPIAENETRFILEKYVDRERPYFKSLHQKILECYLGKNRKQSSARVCRILDALRCPDYPLLEKVNIFLLYRAWDKGKDLFVESEKINLACSRYVQEPNSATQHGDILEHFRDDLMAQLLRESDMKQRYLGFETFVNMSNGLPRNLLIILKHIFNWALFNGEKPIETGVISIKSQQAGVREASEWFFKDARVAGHDGGLIRDSVSRLAELFREIRYSDKPTECSLCTFSADMTRASEEAQRIVDMAEKWSLLISISSGQKDRNSKRVDAKYQLNPMLAPRWDLPVSRRGTLALNPEEVNAIFDKTYRDKFETVLSTRVSRMMAPFHGKSANAANGTENRQMRLPGFDND
ncbi:MAG: hypothetical protein E3K40_15035 [Candidatus Brocadia sp.]|nr:hypothetical protein [Candidatus Brocadia sp.]MDG6027984.1 hypothetical protein [Candidatus Brocadia sp.]